jgi:hypothetical protein
MFNTFSFKTFRKTNKKIVIINISLLIIFWFLNIKYIKKKLILLF